MCLVGDSRVALWPDGYFTGWDVHNIGVGSTTSYDAAYAIYYQTQHFDTLIISTGVNDVAVKASLQESLIALSACIAQAKLKADNVYITTIPGTTPTFGGAAEASFLVSYRAAQINSYLPTIAASHGVGLIHLAYLLNNGIYLKAEYDDGSGIHYNKAAYDVMESLYNRAMGLE